MKELIEKLLQIEKEQTRRAKFDKLSTYNVGEKIHHKQRNEDRSNLTTKNAKF